MEQFGELAPAVQVLDAPVPQLVDKLEDVLKIVDLLATFPRSPAFPVLLLIGLFLCRSQRNSWWTCHCLRGCGWLSGPMPLAGCGLASGSSPRESTGAWRAPGTPSGPARKGSPPAQGGTQILGKAEAAALVVSVTLQLKLQQSIVEFFQVPQLQFIDRVVVPSVASQRQGLQCKLYRRPEIPWCSSGIVVNMPVGVPTTGYGSDSTENCGVPQVQYSERWSMSLLLQFIDVGRPCDYAATQSRSWRCHRFSSSPGLMDIPVRNRDRVLSAVGCDDGYFRLILRHFSLFSVFPELSASFSSFRALTTVSARGLQGAGVAGSLLSGDSALGLPIHPL